MTIADLYNSREMVENFGKSKAFQVARRLRGVWPGFPKYQEPLSEYITAWMVLLCSKPSTSKESVVTAIHSGKNLRCGDELFIVWLGELLTKPERIKDKITSIWIFEDYDFVQVNQVQSLKIFQGKDKVKQVAGATYLSAQFLYDLSRRLSQNLKDESLESEVYLEEK